MTFELIKIFWMGVSDAKAKSVGQNAQNVANTYMNYNGERFGVALFVVVHNV